MITEQHGQQPDPAVLRALCTPILAARTLPERDVIGRAVLDMESAYHQLVAAIDGSPPRPMRTGFERAVVQGRQLIEEMRVSESGSDRDPVPGQGLWSPGAREHAHQQQSYVHARRLADVVRVLADVLALKNSHRAVG